MAWPTRLRRVSPATTTPAAGSRSRSSAGSTSGGSIPFGTTERLPGSERRAAASARCRSVRNTTPSNRSRCVKTARRDGRSSPYGRLAPLEVGVVHHVQGHQVRASVLGHEVRDGLAVGEGECPLGADQAVEPVGVERPRAGPLPHGSPASSKAVMSRGGPDARARSSSTASVPSARRCSSATRCPPRRATSSAEPSRASMTSTGVGTSTCPGRNAIGPGSGGGPELLVDVPQPDAGDELARVREAFAHFGDSRGEGRREHVDVTVRQVHERARAVEQRRGHPAERLGDAPRDGELAAVGQPAWQPLDSLPGRPAAPARSSGSCIPPRYPSRVRATRAESRPSPPTAAAAACGGRIAGSGPPCNARAPASDFASPVRPWRVPHPLGFGRKGASVTETTEHPAGCGGSTRGSRPRSASSRHPPKRNLYIVAILLIAGGLAAFLFIFDSVLEADDISVDRRAGRATGSRPARSRLAHHAS